MEETLKLILDKINSMDFKIGSIDSKLNKLEDHVLIIENKLDNNSKALFDGYQQISEKLNVLENKVDKFASKVETQEVEIRVIKGGK